MTGPSNDLADDWASVLAEDPDFKGLASKNVSSPGLSPSNGLTVSEGFDEDDFAPASPTASLDAEAQADAEMMAMMGEMADPEPVAETPLEAVSDSKELIENLDDMMQDFQSPSEGTLSQMPSETETVSVTELSEEDAQAFDLAEQAISAMNDAIAASQEMDGMAVEAVSAAKKAAGLANAKTQAVLSEMESKRQLLEKSFDILEKAKQAGAQDIAIPQEDVNMVELSAATQDLTGRTQGLRERLSEMRGRLNQLNTRD
jgi:hypothetical protein